MPAKSAYLTLVQVAANVSFPPKPTVWPMSLPAQTDGISDPLKAVAVAGSTVVQPKTIAHSRGLTLTMKHDLTCGFVIEGTVDHNL